MTWILVAVLLAIIGVTVVYDLVQRRHAILRNFPLIGHLRFILEAVGPELRQYIVTDNDEGGISTHHQKRGELVWQIGTAYFGCRDEQGVRHVVLC